MSKFRISKETLEKAVTMYKFGLSFSQIQEKLAKSGVTGLSTLTLRYQVHRHIGTEEASSRKSTSKILELVKP